MASFWKVNNVSVPDATGGQAYSRLLGEEGAADVSASKVLFKVYPTGQEPAPLYLAGGSTLTKANMAASPIAYTGSGSGVYTLPLFYTLGHTRVPGTTPEMSFTVQRQFIGQMFLTPAQYKGEAASQAAMVALSTAQVGDWCQRTDLSAAGSRGGQVFVLTTAPYSTAGNWTALGMTLANRPNIAWGAVANLAGRTGLTNAIVGDFCTQTDAAGATYQLTIAGPSTDANWTLRSDADKPVDPKITVFWNNLDPQYLASHHVPVKLTSSGVGNDEWYAS